LDGLLEQEERKIESLQPDGRGKKKRVVNVEEAKVLNFENEIAIREK